MVPPTTASACEGAGCDGHAVADQVVVPTTSPYGSSLGASFHSPSNNIRCSLDEEQARCDVYENTWLRLIQAQLTDHLRGPSA